MEIPYTSRGLILVIIAVLFIALIGPPVVRADEDMMKRWDLWKLDIDDDRNPYWKAYRSLDLRIASIKCNSLGLDRINADRRAKGMKALSTIKAVARGDEITTRLRDSGEPVASVDYLPRRVNNSELPAFPPIGNQGSLGSCSPFSICYYQATHMMAFVRGWRHLPGAIEETTFSPKFVYTMFNGGKDQGVMPFDVYRSLTTHGCPVQSSFRYVGSFGDPKNYNEWAADCRIWREALGHRFLEAGRVEYPSMKRGRNEAKQLLTNGWVLHFSTPFTFWKFDQIAKGSRTGEWFCDGLLDQKTLDLLCDGSIGGLDKAGPFHSLCVVGYDDDLIMAPGRRGAFLLANSWGTSWHQGNQGFIWLPYDVLGQERKVPPSTGRCVVWMIEDFCFHWLLPLKEAYRPKLLAEVAFSSARRDEVRVLLGAGSVLESQPERLSTPVVLDFLGGDLAVKGRVLLAFDEILPKKGGPCRYFACIFDVTEGSPTTVTEFRIIDESRNLKVDCEGFLPIVLDGNRGWAAVDYDHSTGRYWTDPHEAAVAFCQEQLPAEVKLFERRKRRFLAIKKRAKARPKRVAQMKQVLVDQAESIREMNRRLKAERRVLNQ